MHCLHCDAEITTETWPRIGTVYVHLDGYRDCPPTFATPRLDFT